MTGRHYDFDLYPFSFKEYIKYLNINLKDLSLENQTNIRRYFDIYILNGGFPEVILDNNLKYLNLYFKDIIYRDIFARENILNKMLFENLATYVLQNFSREFTYSGLSRILKIDHKTVKTYLRYLENVYLVVSLDQYTLSPKKLLKLPKKLYIIDPGFISVFGLPDKLSYGRILENIVFIELKRRMLDIFYFRNNKECDFVIEEKGKITKAIQVTYELNDQNRDREIKGLLEAMKYFNLKEGLLLTYDNSESKLEIEGKKIIIKPVWKWLLE